MANIVFLANARPGQSLKDMFIPVSAHEFPSLCKVRDIRMQAWESESVVVHRPLYLTHLLDLEFDFSFLLYLLQDRAMNAIAIVHCPLQLFFAC